MMTAELGACEWFVWDLMRSNLVERNQVEPIVQEFLGRNPKAGPPQLAEHLVEQQVLTAFQAESLLGGKGQILVLGPYIVHDVLGTGSMGTVYRSQSKLNNQWYAVKILPRRSMWNIRIARRKVRDFEAFQHAAVVPFVDVGTAGGLHYLVWPLVEGEPLSSIMEKRGKLPPGEAALYALHIAEGLEACHVRGIIHGLLKPSDVIMTAERQIKILDFGVGALLTETGGESVVDTMSTSNTLTSGLDFASPESIMDPTTMSPASDQYSLGCMLYYFLTGRFPFPVESAVEKMMAHQTYMPTPAHELAPEIPAELSRVIERMMNKSPGGRFAAMSEVIVALRGFSRESVAPMAATPTVPAPCREWPAAVSEAAPAEEPRRALAHSMPKMPEKTSLPPKTPNPPLKLPDRRSLQNPDPPAASAPKPAPRPAAIPQRAYQPPSATIEERLGPVGIAVMALVICAAAWLAAWYLW